MSNPFRNPVATSNECLVCKRRFAPSTRMANCPFCGVETQRSSLPVTWDSERIKAYVLSLTKFNERYKRHEERRERLGRPDPDELGAKEGREEARRWKAFERAYRESDA